MIGRRVRPLFAALAVAALLSLPIAAAAAGPPFPSPVDKQAVYDEAGILSDTAEADAEAKIDAIEERTAAEIVVYTQLVDAR